MKNSLTNIPRAALRRPFTALCAFAALLLLPAMAHAGAENWTAAIVSGVANGNWGMAANPPWSGGTIPTSTVDVTFDTAGVNTSSTSTVLLPTPTGQCNSLTFGDSGSANQAGWIVSGTSMVIATGNVTVNNLGSAVATMSLSSGIKTTGSAFAKLGPGTLVQYGAAAASATYTVANGTLQVGSGAVSSSSLILGDGSGDSGVFVVGAGSTANTASFKSITLGASPGSSCAVVGGATATSTFGANFISTQTVFGNFGGSSGNQANLALAMSGTSATFPGNMDFNGGLSLVKGTATVSGSDTTWGGVTLGSSGNADLILGSASAYPVGDSLTVIASGSGTLDLNGHNATIGALSLTSTKIATIDNVTAGGAVTLTIGQGSTTVAVSGSGVIKNTTGTVAVTKVGTGAATFSTPETYSGITTISAGSLVLATGGTIANTTNITIAASSTFDVSAAGLTLGSAQTLSFNGNGGSGAVNTASGKNLTLGTTSPLVFTNYNGTAAGTVSGAGNLVLAVGNPVTVTVANGGTPLPAATYTLITAGVSGTVPTGVTVNGNGAVGGTTKTLAINAGALQLTIAVGPAAYKITDSAGGSLTAGGSDNLTVTALNGSGATLSSFSAPETLSFYGLSSVGGNTPKVTDKNGTAQSVTTSAGTPNVTLTFVNGVATVSSGANGVLTAYASGSSTLNCTDGTATSTGGDPSAAGLSLAVSPAAVAKMVVATEPSSPVTAGAVFSTQPAVDLEDTYGNLETGDSTSVVTAGIDTGTGPFTGTTTATAVSGVATFSGLAAPTLAQTGGVLKLQFTDSDGGVAALNDTTGITVNPGTANKLGVTTGAGSLQTDGQNFTPSPVISVEDQYGNVVTSDSSTVVASVLSHSGTGTLGGTTSQTASSGVATFSAVNYTLGTATTAETVQVQYTDGGLTAVNNSSITVNPNLTITFSGEPTTTTAGATINSGPGVVVNVETVAGPSPVPDGTSVTISIASGSGSFATGSTLTATTVSGNATFSNLVIDGANTYTLKAAVGLQSANSTPFTVNPGTYSQLQVLLPGQTAAPGTVSGFTGTASNAHLATGYTVTINAVDAYYNLVNTVANGITLSVSDSDSGLPTSGTLASGTTTATFTPTSIPTPTDSVTISAADSTASTTGTSSTFAVYHQNPYYRTTATGVNWSVASTWQSSTDDGNTWATATVAPETTGNAADLVEVTNIASTDVAVTVTDNTALTVSNLFIYAGNTVSVSGVTLTIAQKGGAGYPADDCDVFGTLAASTTASSAVAESGTPVVVFESGGAFTEGIVGGTIPAATWNAASTCTYSPSAAGSTVPAGLGQAFGNFVWNWSAQNGSAILQGAFGTGSVTNLGTGLMKPALGGSIAGNLEITSGSAFSFGQKPDSSSDNLTITIGGTIKVHTIGGNLLLASGGTVAGTYNLKLGGGIIVDSTGKLDMGNGGTNSKVLLEITGNAQYTLGTVTAGNPQDASWQVDNGGTLTLNSSISSTNSSQGTFTVQSGGTLNCSASSTISGGALGSIVFTLDSGATLETANLGGLSATGATGSIQTTSRSFSTGANYIYDGTSSQILGNGLPATVNDLTLASGMTNSVTVVPPASPGGTASSDATVYNVGGTLTANSAVIGYTVGGSGKLIRGTYPIFDYGTLSGSFGTPSNVRGTQGNAPTVSTGSGVVALSVADNAPTATAVTSNTVTGASIKIPISSLIAAGSDFDGDTLSFSSVDATTADGKTISNNGTLIFVPATSNGDTFNYVLSDGIDSISNLVTIDVVAGTGQQGSLTIVGGNVTGTFYGVPGTQYYIQSTPNLTMPITWTAINGGSAYTADSNGLISFTDSPGGSGSYFYRLSTSPTAP